MYETRKPTTAYCQVVNQLLAEGFGIQNHTIILECISVNYIAYF